MCVVNCYILFTAEFYCSALMSKTGKVELGEFLICKRRVTFINVPLLYYQFSLHSFILCIINYIFERRNHIYHLTHLFCFFSCYSSRVSRYYLKIICKFFRNFLDYHPNKIHYQRSYNIRTNYNK